MDDRAAMDDGDVNDPSATCGASAEDPGAHFAGRNFLF